mmetsp:Transcript_45044/g.107107  ORF Transcript_45044/g.107107 Transcript_45044/m.107107 type:complete len:328 (-) Transcript_45044:15-998(-)
MLLQLLGHGGAHHGLGQSALVGSVFDLLRDHLEQARQELGLDGHVANVCKHASIPEVKKHPLLDALQVLRGNLPGQDLAHGAQVLLPLGSLLGHSPLHLVRPALLRGFHALHLQELRVAPLLEVLLVPLQRRQLLLFQHLHHALLQGLAHKHLQHWLALHIEIEQLALLDLRLDVNPDLRGHEERRWWTIKDEVCLRLSLKLHDAVRELLQVRVSLDVHVLPAGDRLRSPGTALRLPGLQPPALGVPLLLHLCCIRLRLHHGGVGITTHYPTVVHDVAMALGSGVIRISVLVPRSHGLRCRRKLLHLSRLHAADRVAKGARASADSS